MFSATGLCPRRTPSLFSCACPQRKLEWQAQRPAFRGRKRSWSPSPAPSAAPMFGATCPPSRTVPVLCPGAWCCAEGQKRCTRLRKSPFFLVSTQIKKEMTTCMFLFSACSFSVCVIAKLWALCGGKASWHKRKTCVRGPVGSAVFGKH